MNKPTLLLTSLALCSALSAGAVLMLPKPVIVSQTVNEGSVDIEWTYDAEKEPCSHFQVIVYKMHRADAPERFVLAHSDFDFLENDGTMKKHKELAAIWDCFDSMPGWYAKFPVYMNQALGIDANQYFAGSDNDDIFGGSYFLSPDINMVGVSDKTLHISADLAREASSVTGGFAVYTWDTDWWDDKNIDYKFLKEHVHEYEDLDNEKWTRHSEECVLTDIPETADLSRTRIAFYGSGHSAYWIDNLEVAVNLAVGDQVDYAASVTKLDKDARTFTIDTSADTENETTYAYQIRAIKEDYDDYRDITTIRFVSHLSDKTLIKESGIGDIVTPSDNISINTVDGRIIIRGADDMTAEVYSISGQKVYCGSAAEAITLAAKGIYVVKVGDKTAKVML